MTLPISFYRLLNEYKVSNSLILQKLFNIAPWKHNEATWKQHNRSTGLKSPIKLFLHLSLVAILTALVLIYNIQWSTYKRASAVISCAYFLPNKRHCDYDSCVGYLSSQTPSLESYDCRLYKRDDVQESILLALNSYFKINTTSIALYNFPNDNIDNNCVPKGRQIPSPALSIDCYDCSIAGSYDITSDLRDIEVLLKSALNTQNIGNLNSFRLQLPVSHQFVTDVFGAHYIWLYKISYIKGSDGSGSFQVRSEQTINNICGINTDLSILTESNGSASEAAGFTYERGIYGLAIACLICSLVYLIMLFLDLMDNLRLFVYAEDIFEELLPTSKSKKDFASRFMRLVETGRYWFWVTIRFLLGLPPTTVVPPSRRVVSQATSSSSADLDSSWRSLPKGGVEFLAPERLYGYVDHSPSNKANGIDGNHEESTSERISELENWELRRREVVDWKNLSLSVKLKLLDGWRLLSILGTLFSIYSASILLQVSNGYYTGFILNSSDDDSSQIVLGLAVFIQYITLLSYLRYSNRFTSSALILWGGFFKVQRIFVSVLPLTIGLLLLGVVLFGNVTPVFGDVGATFITLFSIMNCDSIWDIYNDTNTSDMFEYVGTIYISIIFIFFNYLLLRVVLAAVEVLYYYLRLYMSAKRKRRIYRKTILQKLATDPDEQHKIKVIRHSSEQIQMSLLSFYAEYARGKTAY